VSDERICLECPLFQCVEGAKGCEFTQITRIRATTASNRRTWRRNVAMARQVKTGRRLLGFKKYDRRFRYSNGKGI